MTRQARYKEYVEVERQIKAHIAYRTDELRFANTQEDRHRCKELIAQLTSNLYQLDAEYSDVAGCIQLR